MAVKHFLLFGLLASSGQLLMAQATNVAAGAVTFQLQETGADCSNVAALPNESPGGTNIIHYVVWQEDGKNKTEQWLVRGGVAGALTSKRIFGAHQIRVLAVHRNIPRTYFVNYKIDVKKKSPSWLTNLQSVLGLTAAAPPRVCLAGYIDLTEVSVPSDIVVTGDVKSGGSETLLGGTSSSFTETFDNEGRYWGDFSFGLPVLSKKVTDYEIADGVLRRKEGSRTAAYGFLNLYPGKRDTKSAEFQSPHLMVGLPLTGQALYSPIIATGINVNALGIKFGVFAGCKFMRTEVPGSTPEHVQVRWVRKLALGLNIPVSQFVSAYLKKK